MRRFSQMVVLLAWAVTAEPSSAFSQEVQTTSESPSREISFRILEEPVEKKLFQADKALLEQTVVASIRLQSLFSNRAALGVLRAEELAPIISLATFRYQNVLTRSFHRESRSREDAKTMSESFRRIAMSIPMELRPQDEQLAFFLSEAADNGYVQFMPNGRRRAEFSEIEILAPNQEIAKARSKTLVTLLQKGIADPVRQVLKAQQADLVSRVEPMETKLEEIRQLQEVVKDKLARMGNIEIIEPNRLKAQRQLLDVETAGVRARIRAVEKLREQYEDDIAVGSKLDDIKMAAEIDLAGLAASKEALNEIIQRGDRRIHLSDESQRLRDEYDAVTTNLRNARLALERNRETIEATEDLLMPYEGEVTIRPIKWTQ